MEYTRVAARLRVQIARFSGELSAGLPKVARRLVSEMVYGIQASQSVVLTKIARALEEDVRVKKTEERLSRQLGRGSLGAVVQRNLLKEGASRIGRNTLLIFDSSDLRKRYAKRMEYLCTVRDGSEKELGPGYWLTQVVGAEAGGEELVPLYGALYSTEAPGFTSENKEWMTVVDAVSGAVSKRGVWVMDRGGDRKEIVLGMLDRGLRFLIRMRGDRHIVAGRSIMNVAEAAASCPCPYAETVVKEEGGKERVYHIEFGFRKVRFPGREEVLYLVVVNGFGKEPLMLLTT